MSKYRYVYPYEYQGPNWNKRVVSGVPRSRIAYHTTTKDRLADILQNGLKINSEWNFSKAAQDYIEDIYGMRPIFIAFDSPWEEEHKAPDEVVLKVDITGLCVVADVPSIVAESGGAAYYDTNQYDEGYIWFEYWVDRTLPLEDYVGEDDEIYYYDLIDPHRQVSEIAREITKTGAVMENIGPERISIYRP